VYLVAALVAIACVAAGWGASSRAGAAPASARDDWHLTCGGMLRQGSGVTRIVVKAEKKKEEDSWTSRPTWYSVETNPGYVGEPAFFWNTQAALLRGCSNAITFAVANGQGHSALIGVTLGQSFGGGSAGLTASCHVLTASHQDAHFTCHRTHEDHWNGQLSAWFKITSP
jgi:hypothetical protein